MKSIIVMLKQHHVASGASAFEVLRSDKRKVWSGTCRRGTRAAGPRLIKRAPAMTLSVLWVSPAVSENYRHFFFYELRLLISGRDGGDDSFRQADDFIC